MKKSIRRKIEKGKRSLDRRLEPRNWAEQARPMFERAAIAYDLADRTQAIDCGGLGAFHTLAHRIGLVRHLDQNVRLLKRHLPYHESDHILNLAYNILTGGTRLEDLELRRQDETYLDALGAQRIPDPTTAGDFLRRFETEERVLRLMEAINESRLTVWRRLGKRRHAVIDVDGTLAGTGGECKAGMDISYKGVWGYAPLIVTLANTGEHLYLVNRPGNAPSHQGAAEWLERAVALVRRGWSGVCLRGDTDFALTRHFDEWTRDRVRFVFGMDAHRKLVDIAESLSPRAWKWLKRRPKYMVKTEPRRRPPNVKEAIVQEREYKNIRLRCEDVAEFEYTPCACKQSCRVVVVRKNLSVEKGESRLFDDVRYFFYITNRRDLSKDELVFFANDRGRHENEIEQLKNGVNAMRLPVGDLVSNWAYMVIAALAWNLKAWYAQLMPNRKRAQQVLRMEFRTFLNALVRIPCQILRTGRQRVYRLLGYWPWAEEFFETWDIIRRLRFT